MKGYVSIGRLVPDELVLECLSQEIASAKGKSCIIDGFPRTLQQARMLETAIGEIDLIISMTAPEDVLMNRLMKRVEMEKRGEEELAKINKGFAEFREKTLPAFDYYDRIGKVRQIDCTGIVPVVYELIKKAITPEVICVIGPKAGGKTAVSKLFSARGNMRYLSLSEFVLAKGIAITKENPESLVKELIKEMHNDFHTKWVIDGFPTYSGQLNYYLANCSPPLKVILVKATEAQCLKNNQAMGISRKDYLIPAELCKRIKEFNESFKEIKLLCKTKGLLQEIDNSEGLELTKVFEKANEQFHPEILLARCAEGGESAMADMIQILTTQHQYIELNARSLCNEEIVRKTQLGREIAQYISQEQNIPSEIFTQILHKAIYGSSGHKQFILWGFPGKIEELIFFEQTCGKIAREFYFPSTAETKRPNYIDVTIETYMNKDNRLVYAKEFSYDLMDTYKGVQLQYVLISGPPMSGKGVVAKHIAGCGFTFIDLNVLTEEVKKKLTPEDASVEAPPITYDNIMDELKKRTVLRADKQEKFVFDGLPFDNLDSMRKLLKTIGLPTHYIELSCDIKELKKRYQKKNELADLNEDQVKEFEKSLEPYNVIKQEFSKFEGSVMVHHHSVKTDGTEEEAQKLIKAIFEPKLVLLRTDSGIESDSILTNLSFRNDFLYLNAQSLIQHEVEVKSELGINLWRTRKPKELIWNTPETAFCPIHFDYKLVGKLIKKSIQLFRNSQRFIVIEGLLNAQKLKNWEDTFEIRPMDELLAIEKEIGEINSIINLTKGEYDSVEDERVPEKLFPMKKPEQKIEKTKEGGAEDPAASPEKEASNDRIYYCLIYSWNRE